MVRDESLASMQRHDNWLLFAVPMEKVARNKVFFGIALKCQPVRQDRDDIFWSLIQDSI